MIKMALVYLAPILLLLQATAVPLNDTDTTTTDIFIGNDTLEPDNSTDVTSMPLTNLTSGNETDVQPIGSTEGDMSTVDVSTVGDTEANTMSYTSEPEVTESNPPPTKKANIGNLAVMAQAGTLAIVLPVCVRLMTLWNNCL